MAKREKGKYEGIREVPGTRFLQISRTDPSTGKQLRYSSKTENWDDAARKRAEDISLSYRRKNFGDPVELTVQELLEWYFQRFLKNKPRFNEYNYRCAIKAPLLVFGTTKAKDLKTDSVLEYISDRCEDVSNASINRELSYFRSAFAKSIETDRMLTDNPFKTIPGLRETQRDRSASKEEERKLLEHSAGLMHDLIDFDLAEGLRAGQLRELEWSHIDLDHMRFKTATYKGSRGERYEYWVPLFDRGLAVLKRRPQISKFVFCHGDGRPVHEDGLIHSSFPKFVKSLQIPDFKFHDLRHTFATNDYKAHHDIFGLSLMLGHKSIKTTQIYINLSNEDLLEDRMQLRRAKHSAVSSAAERLLDTEKATGSIPVPRNLSGLSIVEDVKSQESA